MGIADQPVVIDPESDYVVYGEWRNTVCIPNGLHEDEESDETKNQQQTRSDKDNYYQYKVTQILGIRK